MKIFFRIVNNNSFFQLFRIRIYKLSNYIFFPNLIKFLFFGIFPAFEHKKALYLIKKANTLIDCGSNKGQFGLICYEILKINNYISFDPIMKPKILQNYFKKKNLNQKHYTFALSNFSGSSNFFITKRLDSSSLNETESFSKNFFKDVYKNKATNIQVKRLDEYIDQIKNLNSPRILKIDVQGEEYRLLIGSKEVLCLIDAIIVEVTFFSIYKNINFKPSELIKFCEKYGFRLIKKYNEIWRNNTLISADFLFIKK